jgi:hypothetical protein
MQFVFERTQLDPVNPISVVIEMERLDELPELTIREFNNVLAQLLMEEVK